MKRQYNRKPYKKPYKKKAKDAVQDREIRKLKKQVGHPELKYIDTSVAGGSGFTMTTGGQIVPISGVAQGTEPYNRIGNQIKNAFVRIKGYITMSYQEGQDRLVRFQVVWDKSPEGVNPTIFGSSSAGTVCINDTTGTSGLIPNVFAPHAMEQKDRFKIIHDKIIKLQPPNDTDILSVPFAFNSKLNRITRYKDNTSAITSISTNALFLCFAVENVGSYPPTCNVTSRIYFYDS